MSFDPDTLYRLLPEIYRIRDDEQGGPLKALLTVIAEQVLVVEDDLAQLYDDQFIETCADWVVPYIGDLIGYRTLYSVTSQVRTPRSEVANTIGFRRRKGTSAMLEQLARDVTGWKAHVVEFFQLLATTQNVNHIRPQNLSTVDMRAWEPIERLGTPFESTAHTIDVRNIANGRGRYNIPHAGIYLWPLNAYSVTDSPAFKIDDHRYLFSPLGRNVPLVTRPQPEDQIDEMTHLAEPLNVPLPISRRVLDQYLAGYFGSDSDGIQRSIHISATINGVSQSINDVAVCDLSDSSQNAWAHTPPTKVAIDPELGRIAFPDPAPSEVRVTFHHAFSMDMGGGEYPRASVLDVSPQQVPAGHPTIQEALDAVAQLTVDAAVEIENSGRYAETPLIAPSAAQHVELRAAAGVRPTIVVSGNLQINGTADAQVTLNGLLLMGGGVHVSGSLGRLQLLHCTIVPGLTLSINGDPQQPAAPGLVVESPGTIVEIDHCILGGVRAVDTTAVHVSDSIVDAAAESNVAFAAPDGTATGGALQVERSSLIGKVHTASLELASNSIFLAGLASGDTWTAPVLSERRQDGCVRFSYVPPGSRVPRMYRSQPQPGTSGVPPQPRFVSLRYGDPGYGQLSRHCPVEILEGADDGAEMGAFHDTFSPQRQTNVRVRLDEYLRFGLEAGILYATEPAISGG